MPSAIAGYRIESRLGVGGMAVVYRAWDERLRRPVALKVMAPQWAADATFRRRFIAESRSAALVDDPHVIPVYKAGEVDGVLFIAMHLATGGDLRTVLMKEGPLPPARALDLLSPVASALDAAHSAGLIHRDVKPANVLIDVRPGRPDHVYLSDFGLSKGAMSVASVTGPGQYLGTPGYSAPEQVRGHPLDGRADQYSLACMALELLTGSPPFERDQPFAVLLAHVNEAPPALSTRRPELAPAADPVLARALAKLPEERYPSCRDFTGTLRDAFGLPPYAPPGTPDPGNTPGVPDTPGPTGESVPPVPTVTIWPGPAPGTVPETGRGSRRRLTITLACASAAVLAAIAIPLALTAQGPSAPGNGKKPATRTTAQPAALARPELAGTLADPGGAQGGSVSSVAYSPRGTILAAGDSGHSGNGAPTGRIYLWDTATRKLAAALTDPAAQDNATGGADGTTEGVNMVAFSPDGSVLAADDENGGIYLWNTATEKLTADLQKPGTTGPYSLAFSPDGSLLADPDPGSASLSTISLWNARTGTYLTTLTDPDGVVAFAVAFSPGGSTLAVGDQDDHIYLWNTATRKLTATLTDPSGLEVDTVAYSPNSRTLAVGDKDGTVYLWDTANGTLAGTLADPSREPVGSLAFAPGGTALAVSDRYGTYLWNTTTKTITAALTDPGTKGVGGVAFTPDGTTLAAGDGNGGIYLWSVPKEAG